MLVTWIVNRFIYGRVQLFHSFHAFSQVAYIGQGYCFTAALFHHHITAYIINGFPRYLLFLTNKFLARGGVGIRVVLFCDIKRLGSSL